DRLQWPAHGQTLTNPPSVYQSGTELAGVQPARPRSGARPFNPAARAFEILLYFSLEPGRVLRGPCRGYQTADRSRSWRTRHRWHDSARNIPRYSRTPQSNG